MDRITIIGLGLIGGSLGLALKGAKLRNVEVVGFDISWDTVNAAKRKGAVDSTERDLGRALRGAQLVVVATPIMTFPEVFKELAPHLDQGSVVTDVGSTKVQVLQWAEEHLPDHVHFIGGHPMAGREIGGIESASATLFQGATYCLLPSPSASKAAIELVSGMVGIVGATPYFIAVEEHDMLVAGISHLPLLLSSALALATSSSPSWDEMSRLASSGFRDVTRLASGEPDLARGITLTNRAGLLHWIDTYLTVLLDWRKALDEGDPERLLAAMSRAREARDRWMAGRTQEKGETAQELPSSGEQMAEMFMGGRLVRAMREQSERLKQMERGSGRRPDGRGQGQE